MADPHALYIVAAIVIAGLVAWVIAVLVRCDKLPPTPPPLAPAPPGPVPDDPRAT